MNDRMTHGDPEHIPRIDPEALRRLGSLANNAPLIYSRIVSQFQRSSDEAMTVLVPGSSVDPEAFRTQIHRLRGSAASLGAARLAAICEWLELGSEGIPQTKRDEITRKAGEELEKFRQVLKLLS